ncbi:sensor histidine kinase [Motiliproteus sediminis]|uniref:sensor histidine kinase n=1 Tax=Motiliproteus sediminis TaxID=1468178 RepID=UPI001AF00585|nr:response regulator [Motiliproteus sediminis]
MSDPVQQTILAIDDSASARELLAHLLQLQGYQVYTATDGTTGLEAVAEVQPDLILLDINMPGLDGFQVCEQLQDEPAFSNIPVIFLSANSDSDSKVRAFSSGGVDFLTKPFQPEELLARVSTHLKLQRYQQRLQGKNQELKQLLDDRERLQGQVIQNEKMASIGTLAAGVAHEINNPIGYVNSNLTSLGHYVDNLMTLLDLYRQGEATLSDQQLANAIRNHKRQIDYDYLVDDLPALINESIEGLERVKNTVLNLKNFSHAGTGEKVWCDLQQEVENTLSVVWNELKYKAEVVKEYRNVPKVYCVLSHIGQVLMNLLVNAAHAIEEHGTIRISTGCDAHWAWVDIEDDGKGIPANVLPHIFDPFFTTKPQGQGTGLGLSLSLGIIEKHQGKLEVQSEVGKGSRFRIKLPLDPD